jgi:hypothetical protein
MTFPHHLHVPEVEPEITLETPLELRTAMTAVEEKFGPDHYLLNPNIDSPLDTEDGDRRLTLTDALEATDFQRWELAFPLQLKSKEAIDLSVALAEVAIHKPDTVQQAVAEELLATNGLTIAIDKAVKHERRKRRMHRLLSGFATGAAATIPGLEMLDAAIEGNEVDPHSLEERTIPTYNDSGKVIMLSSEELERRSARWKKLKALRPAPALTDEQILEEFPIFVLLSTKEEREKMGAARVQELVIKATAEVTSQAA